jgi:O-antigen/teichoic acid export membrane protein
MKSNRFLSAILNKNSDSNSLLKQLKDFAGGPIIGVFVSLFTVPLVTRLVSPEEFGKSALFTLLQTLFSLLALFGLDQSYVRYFNSKEYKDKELLFNAIVLPLVITFVSIIGIIFFQKPLSYWMFGSFEKLIILYFCPFLISLVVYRFAMLIIRMELRGKLYSTLSVAAQVINFFILLLFLLLYERSFKSIIYAAITGGLVNTVISVWFCREKWDFKLSYYNRNLINKLLQFGLPLVPATALTWILNSFDKVGLKQWSTYEQLGLYSAAFKIASLLGVLQTIFTTAWIPVAYKWYEDNEDTGKFKQVNAFVLAAFCLVFSLIVLFRNIIIMFLGSEYRDASMIMIYLLFVPFMYTLTSAVAIGIDLKKKTIYNALAVFISVIVNIISNYFLIPVFGAKGAAISTAYSFIICFLIKAYFARKLWYKFPVKNIFVDIFLVLLLIISVETGSPVFFEIIIFGVILLANFIIIKRNIVTA